MLKNFNALLVRSFMELSFFLKNPAGNAPLVIYQMGKVGSTSIMRSLEREKLSMPLFQVHYLNAEILEKFIQNPFEDPLALHMCTSRYLMRLKHRGNKPGKPWKIISPVRDPVARNISAFFENIKVPTLGIKARYDRGEVSDEEFIKVFMDRYPHELPLKWFDSEMKPVFGIDVFAEEFDISKGYRVYKGERAELLVLRLESLKQSAPEAFNEFLGLEGFELKSVNVGADKKYNKAYKRMLDTIVLPEEYLDKMYNSKYARYFYSPDEIKGFRKRWGKR